MKHSLWRRFVLFVRYDVSGVSSFIVELGLLYIFLNSAHMRYMFAVPLAFVLSTTVQWATCHWWVFNSSHRPAPEEYAYFVSILFSGLIFATAFVVVCAHFFGMDPFFARVLSGTFTGLWGFYLNARLNFRSKLYKKR